MDLLLAPIRVAVPLLLASHGELVAQRAGILNLGIEGQMLLGAFLGWWAYSSTGSVATTLIVVLAAGIALGCAFWILIDLFECSQHVVGLGLGIACGGLALSIYRSFGTAEKALLIPHQDGSAWILVAILGVLAGALMCLEVSARRSATWRAWSMLGTDLRAADLLGIRIRAGRLFSAVYAVSMALFGGATLSVLVTRSFTIGIVSGRGWVALTLVILCQWRPVLLAPAALFWGGLEVAQLHAQAAGVDVPYQLLLVTPYLGSLLVVLLVSSSRAPRMLLKTYKRNEDAA